MRKIVADILYKYKSEGSYINIELNYVFKQNHLNAKDKDLVTQIVYGTIQNELYLDYQLKPYIKGKIKLYEQVVLLMSLYQLIFLDKIPDYAIINEAVEIVKNKHGIYKSKTVNAILRNFIKNGKREIITDDPLEKISIETSTPLWLVKMFNKQLGQENTEKVCFSTLKKPPLTARVNTLKANRQDILKQYSLKKGKISEDAVIFEHGNIAHHSLFKEGKITIQDESSQLVGHYLSPKKESYVLDMCCAPGSKTTHLAAIMENTGHIDAFDLYEHKIRLVEENLERLGVTNTTVRAYDSTKLSDLYKAETFDYILLDAPCSGLGVMARKPEIKYQDSHNMDGIIQLQKELLKQAYYLLKKGGTLVYSTCTINKKENQLQIENFIKDYPKMKKEKEQLILPFFYDSDGFYMCRIIKE